MNHEPKEKEETMRQYALRMQALASYVSEQSRNATEAYQHYLQEHSKEHKNDIQTQGVVKRKKRISVRKRKHKQK